VGEQSRITYRCKSCNNIFFSMKEVTEHKAMTGHREFIERK
jgi:hypothetical protein